MSERGSFATEMIWCQECYQATGKVLRRLWGDGAEADFCIRGTVFPNAHTHEFQRGMWAGIVRSTYEGGEIHVFEDEVNNELQGVLCHPLQLVVFAECGVTQVFSLLPTGYMLEHAHSTDQDFPAEVSRDSLGLAPGESLAVQLHAPSGLLQVEHRVDEQMAEDMAPTTMFAHHFSRYMMATTARWQDRDMSRTETNLCFVYNEEGEDWIGQWVTHGGIFDMRFPKATTRALTEAERVRYRKRHSVGG